MWSCFGSQERGSQKSVCRAGVPLVTEDSLYGLALAHKGLSLAEKELLVLVLAGIHETDILETVFSP